MEIHVKIAAGLYPSVLLLPHAGIIYHLSAWDSSARTQIHPKTSRSVDDAPLNDSNSVRVELGALRLSNRSLEPKVLNDRNMYKMTMQRMRPMALEYLSRMRSSNVFTFFHICLHLLLHSSLIQRTSCRAL